MSCWVTWFIDWGNIFCRTLRCNTSRYSRSRCLIWNTHVCLLRFLRWRSNSNCYFIRSRSFVRLLCFRLSFITYWLSLYFITYWLSLYWRRRICYCWLVCIFYRTSWLYSFIHRAADIVYSHCFYLPFLANGTNFFLEFDGLVLLVAVPCEAFLLGGTIGDLAVELDLFAGMIVLTCLSRWVGYRFRFCLA